MLLLPESGVNLKYNFPSPEVVVKQAISDSSRVMLYAVDPLRYLSDMLPVTKFSLFPIENTKLPVPVVC